jgi:hypothetical protein
MKDVSIMSVLKCMIAGLAFPSLQPNWGQTFFISLRGF